MQEEQSQNWLLDFLNGDPKTVQGFWTQYGPMLERVAAKHMGDRLRTKLGPEDVVQSACRTFFRRAKAGEFCLDDADELWRLLCAITVTKVREQARFHSRQKRSVDREVASDGALPLAAAGPTPDEAAEFSDHFEKLLRSLDDEERAIVDLKLQDYTHDEVAERLGVSERTVRRIFKRLQSKLARNLGGPGEMRSE